jgi:hypothetical protein
VYLTISAGINQHGIFFTSMEQSENQLIMWLTLGEKKFRTEAERITQEQM